MLTYYNLFCKAFHLSCSIFSSMIDCKASKINFDRVFFNFIYYQYLSVFLVYEDFDKVVRHQLVGNETIINKFFSDLNLLLEALSKLLLAHIVHDGARSLHISSIKSSFRILIG